MALHGAFQTPTCESDFAVFGTAVYVLSDAHVHSSGKSFCVSHVILVIVPSHALDAHVWRGAVESESECYSSNGSLSLETSLELAWMMCPKRGSLG